VPIPLQVFPYVGALTNLVTLVLALPILLAVAFVTGAGLGPSILLLPFYLACLFIMAYAVSMESSIFHVYLRDLRHIMGIVVQIWQWATPVIYDESMIPPKYKWLLFVNPVGTLFADLHSIFVAGTWPSPVHILTTLIWSLLMAASCVLIQKYFAKGLVESI
jgi:ABC-type polysaccharide/polyol phosphate export permease